MNEYPNVLVLGDGLLGSHIISQTGWDYLCESKDDIDVVSDFDDLMVKIDDIEPDIIVNCIGYTNTYGDSIGDKKRHWDVNYGFVVNLVDFCDSRDYDLVHISTDYIYANSQGGFGENDIPVHQETWYAYCKLLADAYVQLSNDRGFRDHLLIRCSFKPTPFPYDKAFTNVRGTFDYVDTIAEQIITLIKNGSWGVWNIGTPSKTMYELAKQTKPDVSKSYSRKLPSIELDLTKFQNRNK
jgi:dTDP-4-dehydrorhamnose reductase